MSLSTDKEVEAIYKPKPTHPLSCIMRSPSTNGKAHNTVPRLDEVNDLGNGENSSANVSLLLNEQRKDIDRILRSLDELQHEMKSVKKSVSELRATSSASLDGPSAKSGFAYEEELDLLADSVSAVASKVNEVDGLKLEIKLLKRRLQRVEESNGVTQSSHTVTGLTQESQRAAKRPHTKNKRRNLVEQLLSASDGNDSASDTSDADGIPNLSKILSQERDDVIIENDVEMTIEPSAADELESTLQDAFMQAPANRSSMKPNIANGKGLQENVVGEYSPSDTPSHVSPIPARRPKVPPSDTSSLSDSSVSLVFVSQSVRPRAPTSRKGAPSAISLNRHNLTSGSDPEDEDYSPSNNIHNTKTLPTRGNFQNRRSHHPGRHSVPGFPVPDPERERSGRTGTTNLTPRSTHRRGRGILRRGVSGRAVSGRARGPASEPRRIPIIIPTTNRGQQPAVDRLGRSLNAQGIPIRANGLLDRRFLKRPRDDRPARRGVSASGRPLRLTNNLTPDRRYLKRGPSLPVSAEQLTE